MKRILLVDDDAVVLELYRKKLSAGGFEVHTAQDGLHGIKSLGAFQPDLVVLDLMMPKLSGADVLKYLRAQPALAKIPVVILTNDFASEQARAVSALNVAQAIAKGQCTPAKMLDTVNQLLGIEPNDKPATKPTNVLPASDTAMFADEAREQFLTNAAESFTDLQYVSGEFAQDPAAAPQSGNLTEFYRRTHHLAGAAGLAGCHNVALMGGALEALLNELVAQPQLINPSTARTIAASVDLLGTLIADARTARGADTIAGQVLVVDDDPLANRIALAALSRANLRGQAVEDPHAALRLLAQHRFELVLLDVEMPHLTGFEMGRKLRLLPGYENTPVIYVTAHSDFESRSRSILSGGNDLIAKPILPIELAVKAVSHLLRGRLAAA
jgi:CheY-like chemotaxis protein